MPATHFPFLIAQRAIDEACDWLDEINAPTHARRAANATEALDSAQMEFRRAVEALQAYTPKVCVDLAQQCPGAGLLRKTSVEEAKAGSQMLAKMISGILEAEAPPSSLTSGVIITIRSFLGMSFPDVVEAERILQEALEECLPY